MTKKLCTKCTNIKLIEEFCKNKAIIDGRSAWCRTCMKDISKTYRKNNKEKCRQQTRNWRLKNREQHLANNKRRYNKYKESILARTKEWAEKFPDKRIDARLKNKFGLTLEEYKKILERQGGQCYVCARIPEEYRNKEARMLAVDHCHSSGKIRGLLCGNHNRALGMIKDSIEALEVLIHYLNGT